MYNKYKYENYEIHDLVDIFKLIVFWGQKTACAALLLCRPVD